MGLTERFRGKLDKMDIYKEPSVQTNTVKLNTNTNLDYLKKFEDLETDAIKKIRTTPYWEDYPLNSQENMISKYFDNKIKTKYSDIVYTKIEKQGFIKNILTYANNK